MHREAANVKRQLRGLGYLGILVAIVFTTGFFLRGLAAVPSSQAEVEAHLDREILAYAVISDVPWIVFQLDDRVCVDRLILDLVSIEWPPTPRWQWSGQWASIPATTESAIAGSALIGGLRIVYGQVDAPEIVTLQVLVDGQWPSYPVSGGGFIVRLPDAAMDPAGYQWLDADGREVWSQDLP